MTFTKRQLAKSLMDLALEKSDAVEYTAPYSVVFATRVECYKLRSMSKDLGMDIYNPLKFSTRDATGGMRTLIVERR